MSDKLMDELNSLQQKRKDMRDDLVNHPDLSKGTQQVIRVELSILSADIINLRKEIDDMNFQEFMHNAWNGETDE